MVEVKELPIPGMPHERTINGMAGFRFLASLISHHCGPRWNEVF
jgi:hypothetical protein